MKTGTATLGERVTRVGLTVLTGAVLLFLVAPILTIVPLSFSSGSFLYYPLPGLSLRWYEDFFASAFWLSSLRNSLIVGISATVLATGLGTLAALGIWRARFPAQALVLAILISPMVVPTVIVAVGAYFAFAASFDEVVVVLLMAGPGQRTLPRQMFAGINDNISLTIAAAATMLIAISVVLMIAVSWLQRRSARMRQSRG